MSWFKIGEEGFKEKLRRDALITLKREKTVSRFWLKVGEEASIVFVDDDGFYIKSHQLKIDNNFNNFITCVQDFKPCVVCDSGKKPTLICYYTVIDLREITLKDGTKQKNRKVLYPAKGIAINILLELKKKHKTLVGKAIKVKRYSIKSPNCGDFIELISPKTINISSKFGKDAAIPIDYEKVLAPPTPEELASLGFKTGYIIGEEESIITDDNIDDTLSEILE